MPRRAKPAPAKRAAKPKAKHGGTRAGAGRKRDRLPQSVIDRLGAPGTTPREIRIWNAKLLAEVQLLNMKGEISNDLAASIRANAGAIDRALPAERPPGDEDDDEDEDGDGPEPVPVTATASDGGLRVG
jgi:hypothetical protein